MRRCRPQCNAMSANRKQERRQSALPRHSSITCPKLDDLRLTAYAYGNQARTLRATLTSKLFPLQVFVCLFAQVACRLPKLSLLRRQTANLGLDFRRFWAEFMEPGTRLSEGKYPSYILVK